MDSHVETGADDTIARMPTRHHDAAEDARTAALFAWIDARLDARALRRLDATPLPAAASFRRFTRIATQSGTLMAVDAPPERENNDQFVRLSAHFRAHDIPVPEIVEADLGQGFFLVTDFGDRHFADVYGTVEEEPALEAALEALVRLQQLPPGGVVPPYTAARMRDEFELFPVWLLDGLLASPPDRALRAQLDDVREQLVAAMTAQPSVCVHRDYHSENLMWRPPGALGIVDFQDALYGPLCYDLASLLRDCYHRFSEAVIARWRARYVELARAAGIAVPDDAAQFAAWLDATALQRQIKAVGIFARLRLRDDRSRHLADIAPVLDHIADTAQRYSTFAAFGAWVRDTVVPAARAQLDTPDART
jgi:hypothetical protein